MLARILVLPVLAANAASLPEQAANLLQRHCASCHGSSVSLSNLRLDSPQALAKGGARGPAIDKSNPAASLLLRAVSHSDPKLVMPPTGKLPAADLAILRDWVLQGAPWPQAAQSAAPKFWSFVKPAATPGVTIDSAISAALSARQLPAAPRASKRALIRRATLNLHGLPPTAQEIAAFEADSSPEAYARLIDRLLASPRYGERWAKHWLDLARYGDTAGFEQDPYTLYAWRYRDYVIKSFNADKPYNRFVLETIAGDELFEEPEAQQGTGFYCVGPNRDMLYKVEDINRAESLTDFVDTTASVFLGLSAGCARCHDHKYDPISQRDYHRLQAIFAPFQKTRVFLQYNTARGYDLSENTRTFKLYDYGAEMMAIRGPYQEKIKAEKLAALPADVQQAFAVEEENRTPQQKAYYQTYLSKVTARENEVLALMTPGDKDRLRRAEQKIASLFATYQPGPFSPGLTDVGREAPRTYLPNGEEVGPGLPAAFGGGEIPEPPKDSPTTQRRRALAQWIASEDNPLTARVLVNRVWHYHFGRGLVATPSDFGARGAAPSHPELLDTLAVQFMRGGWSLKNLHRQILLSEAYQRSATPAPGVMEKDPENVYLSRFTRRRLDAEEIRDAVLQSAGTLNEKMYGRPVVPELSVEELYGMSQPIGNAWVVTSDRSEHTRRAIYMISRRNFRMPLLEVFDRPDGVLSCSRRESSTTAPQSLSLLNGKFTLEQARALAAKASSAEEVFGRILARTPSADEQRMAEEFLTRQTALIGSRQGALTEFARGLLNTNEFLYVD